MLIGTSNPGSIPQYIRNQLRSLTFRWKSPMKEACSKILRGVWAGKIVYYLSEDREKVLCWGLLVWKTNACYPEIMLYTRRGHRGKGLARQVFWGLRHSIHPQAQYVWYPHDKPAHDFYTKRFNERVTNTMPYPEVLWVRQ